LENLTEGGYYEKDWFVAHLFVLGIDAKHPDGIWVNPRPGKFRFGHQLRSRR